MVDVDVLIVGGGAAGLTASILLRQLGVATLLVSALETTSVLPKAHELNQRAMEVLHDCGIGEEVVARSTPPAQMSHTAFYLGFAGHPSAGKQLAKMECWGGGGTDPEWTMASPYLHANLPQLHLEPIMKRRAEELAPDAVRFGHRLVHLDQDDDGVTATIEVVATGERYDVRSTYLIAADGGRTCNDLLGVQMEGLRDLAQEVSVHFSADLSALCSDDSVLIRWIFLPHDPSALCVLVPMGPTRWGTTSEEWVYHANYTYGDPRAFDDAAVLADMAHRLGIEGVELEVHLISRWTLGGVLADRFSQGRVFLVGDAAHRHPPTGGLGLNSALHDVQNLAWKLAYVLDGTAEPSLLETYGQERRPVDARNVDRALENSLQWVSTAVELGLGETDEDVEETWARLARACSTDPRHGAERAHVVEVLAQHSMEFHEHSVEYSYEHQSQAVVPDGTTSAADPDFHRFTPEARPGHPLPHAVLEDHAQHRCSTLDLIDGASLVVLAGEDGGAWVEAAEALAADGLPIAGYRIGHLSGDYLDPRVRWQYLRGHGPTGAIVVRPDRCVAWRSHEAVDDHHATLSSVVAQILGR